MHDKIYTSHYLLIWIHLQDLIPSTASMLIFIVWKRLNIVQRSSYFRVLLFDSYPIILGFMLIWKQFSWKWRLQTTLPFKNSIYVIPITNVLPLSFCIMDLKIWYFARIVSSFVTAVDQRTTWHFCYHR